jgi:integrase
MLSFSFPCSVRIIPIIDKELFNSLASRYKDQEKLLEKKKFGPNPKNYLLFDNLTTTEASVALRAAYAKTKFKPKSYHCCRHTRCTELVGQTRDFVLARYWLGHSRQETTLRYTHIYQQSVRQVRKNKQKIEFLQ